MEKRIYNQSNTIYRDASRMGFEKSLPSRTRSYMESTYNQRLPEEGSFQTNLNQQVSNYSPGYQQNVNQRSVNSSQSRIMSLDRSKMVEYPVDIYPKSTLEDIRIDYVRQAESNLENDDRSRVLRSDFGGNYQTNIQRSPVSNSRNDYQSRSLISEQNTHRSSPELELRGRQRNIRESSPDLRGRQRNIRENSPELRVGYRRSSDSFRTSRWGRSPERNETVDSRSSSRWDRSPERNETVDSRSSIWRRSPESYRNNDNSFNSFSSTVNIPSLLDSRMMKMQAATERFVEPILFTRREHSSVSSGLTIAERSLGYGSTLSSGITEAERSLRFKPPVTTNFKGFRSANQNLERNSGNRSYPAEKRTSGAVQSFSNNYQKPYTPSKNWIGKPTQNVTGLKPGLNISGTKHRPNISGIKPRPNISGIKPRPNVIGVNRGPNVTGVKPRPNVTGVKPRPNVTGLKPRPNFTGVKPRPNVTGVKPGPNDAGVKPGPNVAGVKPRPSITGIEPKPNVTRLKPGPNITGVKPGANVTVVKQSTKPVISVNQGSIPTGLQNRKRKMNVTSQVKDESWKKPKFESPGSNTRKVAEVTEVRKNPPPVPAGTSQAIVQPSGTNTAKKRKKKKKKKNKPIVLDAKPQSIEPDNLSLVVLRNFPLHKMNTDQTELAKKVLLKEIEKVDESMRLQFANCYRRSGTLLLFSKDDEAHEWLTEVVKTLEPWDGAEFRVIRQGPQNFTWAIIALTEFPERNMSLAQLSDLEKALVNKMDEEPEETCPRFVDCYHRRGTLMLAHTSQEDLEWLKNTVHDLQLFEGGQLQVIDINDMPEFNKIEMRLPFHPVDIDKVLARLDRQNTGLNTKKWYVIRHRQKTDDTSHTHTFVVSVDDDVIEALKKIDFQPFLNFTRITLVDGGKLRNVPFTASEYEEDLKKAKLVIHSNVDKNVDNSFNA